MSKTEVENIKEVDIFNICKKIGISCGLSGYQYIKSMISLISKNENLFYQKGGLGKLYELIAEEYNTTWTNVERNIRHCVSKAFEYGELLTINKIFGTAYSSEKGKPCNKEFIGNLYEYIKLCEREE